MVSPADAASRNQRSTERLRARTSVPDSALVPVSGDWTVSATLAHLAFWDGVARGVLARWASGAESRLEVPTWHDDVVNDAMLGLALALPPAEAASQALRAASAMDAALAGLSHEDSGRLGDESLDPATDTAWLLRRYRHRELHLDAIDAALAKRSGALGGAA